LGEGLRKSEALSLAIHNIPQAETVKLSEITPFCRAFLGFLFILGKTTNFAGGVALSPQPR
jgi:hypothetical protein